MRDELVRALMPELRMLVEHLVKTTIDRSIASIVERQHELEAMIGRSSAASPASQTGLEALIGRSLAPLLDKQRELEAALGDLRREPLRVQHALGVASPHAPELIPSTGTGRSEPRPLLAPSMPTPPGEAPASRPMLVERTRLGPRTDVLSAAYDTSVLADLPAELNGSRRKRAALWILGIGVVLLVLSVAGVSLMSHSGTYL